jgi:hypothetical protein
MSGRRGVFDRVNSVDRAVVVPPQLQVFVLQGILKHVSPRSATGRPEEVSKLTSNTGRRIDAVYP